MGYDAQVFTSENGFELSFISLPSFEVYIIRIACTPIFETVKEHMEGSTNYDEKNDQKFYFRQMAQVQTNQGFTVEELMKQEFGELKLDFASWDEAAIKAYRETDEFKKYKDFVDAKVFSDQSYKDAFLKNLMMLQVAMNSEKVRYQYKGIREFEKDLLKMYLANDWKYTFILLNHICGVIKKS